MVIFKRIMHALSILCYILVGIFVLIELPIIFGYKPLIVLTGSMEPTYKTGSIIYYHKVPESELREGDVITFDLDSSTPLTHRIKSIKEGKYQTKGDANDSADPSWIEYKDIRGKVAKISIPFVGRVFAFFLNHYTIIVVMLVLILVYEFLIKNLEILYKNRKKGREENEKR